MYRVLITEDHVQHFGCSQVFLGGNLNMRLGAQEGDTTTNHVSRFVQHCVELTSVV